MTIEIHSGSNPPSSRIETNMRVKLYTDKAGEHRWHILGEGDEVIHACHEGFSSKHNALNNLFVNHALMAIFLAQVAQGNRPDNLKGASVYFEEDKGGKDRWKVRAANGEPVGQAHKGFDDTFEAMDNLVMTYTMLSMFVAGVAKSKSGKS